MFFLIPIVIVPVKFLGVATYINKSFHPLTAGTTEISHRQTHKHNFVISQSKLSQ